MSNNVQIRVADCNSNPYVTKKVLFTPTKSPEITSSFLSVADSYQFTSSASGTLSASVVASLYKVEIANPKPESFFYLHVTETGSVLVSGSTVTGSSQYVFFNLLDLIKDPFDVRKVMLTPSTNYPVSFSGSIIGLSSTSSVTDDTGSCFFESVVPGVYQVDAVGKVTTTFHISVPYWVSTGSDAPRWNAKDLLVVSPSKGTKVKVNGADNSYVLTVSASDARYTLRSLGENAVSASFASSSLTATSASWASKSISTDSASYAGNYVLKTGDSMTGPLTISNGVLSASRPFLDGAQTWNSSSTAFTALKLNVTDSGSATTSKLADLQVGGSSKLSITKDGCVILPNGSATAPAIAFAGSTTSGFYHTFLGRFIYVANGVAKYYFAGGTLNLAAPGVYGWSSTSDPTNVADLFLSRDAAGTLALRNGNTGQVFNLYGSSTDTSNYERLFIGHSNAASFHIMAQNAGTGIARNLVLAAADGAKLYLGHTSATHWHLDSSGHFLADTDDTYDIGADSGNRPRKIYAGHISCSVITASLNGTASYATTAGSVTSASFASNALSANSASWASASVSASFATNAATVTSASFASRAFAANSASWASSSLSSSVATTASYVVGIGTSPMTASWALSALSSNYASASLSSSFASRSLAATSASWASASISASYALNARSSSFADNINLNQPSNIHFTYVGGGAEQVIITSSVNGSGEQYGGEVRMYGNDYGAPHFGKISFNNSVLSPTEVGYIVSDGDGNLTISGSSLTILPPVTASITSASYAHYIDRVLPADKHFQYSSADQVVITASIDPLDGYCGEIKLLSNDAAAQYAGKLTFGNPAEVGWINTDVNGIMTVSASSVNLIGSRNIMSSIVLPVQSAKLPATSSARVDAAENNWRLLYDAGAPQSASWQFIVPSSYLSNPTASFVFSMNATQTGTNKVIWRISTWSPSTSTDVNSLSNVGVFFTSSLANNQAAGLPVYAKVPIAASSITASNYTLLTVERCATASADTATSDAELLALSFEFNS